MADIQCVATFDTTHMALRFEKTCRANGFDVRIIPVPRAISASCGFACRMRCDEMDEIKKLCAEKNIEVAAYHRIS